MRTMTRAALLCCFVSLFVVGTMAADTTEVQVFDHLGNVMTDVNLAVILVSDDGRNTSRTVHTPSPDGTFEIEVGAGQKARFNAWSNQDVFQPIEIKLPEVPGTGPLPITFFGVPANDDCANAIAIEVGTTTAGTTLNATDDSGTAFTCGAATLTTPGVWYTVEGTGTTLTASTCNDADYDTKISAFCQECAALVCVDGNDDGAGCAGFTSELDFCTQAGATYSILVHGYGGETGNFNLSLSDSGVACQSAVECIPPDPQGACCINSSGTTADPPSFAQGETPVRCVEVTAADCGGLGGAYQGDDTFCVNFVQEAFYENTTIVAIPDGAGADLPGAAATLDIAVPDALIVDDLNVGVNIAHTWIGDLIVDVSAPSGDSIVLWNRNCNGGQFIDLVNVFDDDGTSGFCNANGSTPAPTDGNGRITPLGGVPLSALSGQSATGLWTLSVTDNFSADTGSVLGFSLEFGMGTPICPNFDCPAGGGGTEPPGGKKGDDEADEEDESVAEQEDEEDDEDEDRRVVRPHLEGSNLGDISDFGVGNNGVGNDASEGGSAKGDRINGRGTPRR